MATIDFVNNPKYGPSIISLDALLGISDKIHLILQADLSFLNEILASAWPGHQLASLPHKLRVVTKHGTITRIGIRGPLAPLGQRVTATIDRPIGSTHPQYSKMVYPVNYGYIPNIVGGDDLPQDVYLLGTETTGTIQAVIHRLNDNEDKWVLTNERVPANQILARTKFQEQYFQSLLIYTLKPKQD